MVTRSVSLGTSPVLYRMKQAGHLDARCLNFTLSRSHIPNYRAYTSP